MAYWVGFGPAMACKTQLCSLDFVDFRRRWCFGLKLLFWGNRVFFQTLCSVPISPEPYYQNARIDRGIIFGFRRNLRNCCKLQVRSGFLGVSLMSAFSPYFINLSGTLCGAPPGPTAAAVALTVRAAPPPQAPMRAAPGPRR